MSKRVDFVIPLIVPDDYSLHHHELKTIQSVFKELYPDWDKTVYFNDERVMQRYFISGWYKERDNIANGWDTHHFSKIIELPLNFELSTVEEIAGISCYQRKQIETLSKL